MGRAIALAQNFEWNCKFVFGTWDIGRAYKDGQLSDDGGQFSEEQWRAQAKKLQQRSLGAALKAQQTDPEFSAEEIQTLEHAREARNYLAHEAAAAGLYVPPRWGKIRGTEGLRNILSGTVDRDQVQKDRMEMLFGELRTARHRLGVAVRKLVRGDNLVAGWSYAIQEKEDRLPPRVRTYELAVLEWVLEPLGTIGGNESELA